MKPHGNKHWWRRKRVMLPLLSLVLIAGAIGLAVWRSDTSTVVVYNQSGGPLPGIIVRACNQSRNVARLDEDASFRLRLEPHGEGGEVGLELATEPPTRWHGAHVEPTGGYRVTLRVWPAGEVEAHTQISIWQRWFKSAPDVSE